MQCCACPQLEGYCLPAAVTRRGGCRRRGARPTAARPPAALANLPPQIAASSIVGATEEGDRAVRIWYMPALRGASDKPTRKLHKTPAIRLADERDAQTAVRHIRQACCWAGRPEPPRLLVIINPASGPGRWARLSWGAQLYFESFWASWWAGSWVRRASKVRENVGTGSLTSASTHCHQVIGQCAGPWVPCTRLQKEVSCGSGRT